jgi:hypothetical protein
MSAAGCESIAVGKEALGMLALNRVFPVRSTDLSLVLGAVALACAGCSSKPSTSDIHKAFASRLGEPDCARSVMFKSFPVTLSDSGIGGIRLDNASSFDAFVAAGLLTGSGNTYNPTPAGRMAYRPEKQGFCYSDGYEIRKIADVADVPARSSPIVDKGWFVTLEIAQKPVAGWTRTSAVSALALDKKALSTEPQTYHVTLAHIRGKDGIEIDDPMFMLVHGFDVSDGF